MKVIYTNVEYFMQYVVFSMMEYKDRMRYNNHFVIIKMVENKEILINDNIATSIYETITDGDIVTFNGIEYKYDSINRLCGGIAYEQNRR